VKTHFIVFAIILSLIAAGCSTTTYINLEEKDRIYIVRQLGFDKEDKDMGAEVSLLFRDGAETYGELLSVRDSTMTICKEYSATEEELARFTYSISIITNTEIQELTIEGSSYVWPGIIGGQIVGGLIGIFVAEEGLAILAGLMVGGALGIIGGGIIGYALSTEEYILQEIPPDYNWSILKPLSRYPDEEPEYLRAIK